MESPLQSTYGERAERYLDSADAFHKQRYRLNRRLHKLRKSLDIHVTDTKNYREKEQISKIDLESYNRDKRYGDIILFTAERDHMYSDEVKEIMKVHHSKSREKFIVSRLKRSLDHGRKLLILVGDEPDEMRKLEVFVYVALIQGKLSIANKNWTNAQYALSVARCGLQFLDKYGTETQTDLYNGIIDTHIDQMLKFVIYQATKNNSPILDTECRHHIRTDTLGYLDQARQIIESKDPEFLNVGVVETQLIWWDYDISIHSEEVAKLISDANEKLQLIEDGNVSSYDPALLTLQEALDAHQLLMARNVDNFADDDQNNHVLLSYIRYLLLITTLRRDITLIDQVRNRFVVNSSLAVALERAKDVGRIFDNIVKKVNELKDVPGVYNKQEEWNSLQALDAYFQASKIQHLASTHLLFNRSKESLALLIKAKSLVKGHTIAGEYPTNFPTNKDLSSILEQINQDILKAYVLAKYKQESSLGGVSEYDFIADNRNKVPSNPSLHKIASVSYKNVKPVNVKPVLFDIAFNYVSQPNQIFEEPIESSNEQERQADSESPSLEKKKKGLFGLFR
ncbi:hypothetical protein LJB42_002285 [Komagataella kurtzmanii]|nr:hypothetical protein LJB42_002285 [Komagataella kurtzmanii]